MSGGVHLVIRGAATKGSTRGHQKKQDRLIRKRKRGLQILANMKWIIPHLRELGAEVHVEQPADADSWRTRELIEVVKQLGGDNHVHRTDGCAWDMKDRESYVIKKPWKIATSCEHMGRMIGNHRCDGRHAHRPISGARTEASAQYPQRLCRAVAQQIMSKNYLDDMRGTWPVDVSEEVEAAPAAERKPAPWSIAAQIDKLTAKEKKDINNWLRKVHRQIGHRSNRKLVELLKARGTHPVTLEMARTFKCDACEEHVTPKPRNVVASYDARPGEILEIDGMKWRHPVTGRHCRCQIIVDVGSRSPIVTTFEEGAIGAKITNNNSSEDCRRSLVKDWMTHRPRSK